MMSAAPHVQRQSKKNKTNLHTHVQVTRSTAANRVRRLFGIMFSMLVLVAEQADIIRWVPSAASVQDTLYPRERTCQAFCSRRK
jgi:hypothetical protein